MKHEGAISSMGNDSQMGAGGVIAGREAINQWTARCPHRVSSERVMGEGGVRKDFYVRRFEWMREANELNIYFFLK